MGHGLIKRSINLAGHATSLALEAEFWDALERMSAGERLSALVLRLDKARGERGLASACRVAALTWALDQPARCGPRVEATASERPC